MAQAAQREPLAALERRARADCRPRRRSRCRRPASMSSRSSSCDLRRGRARRMPRDDWRARVAAYARARRGRRFGAHRAVALRRLARTSCAGRRGARRRWVCRPCARIFFVDPYQVLEARAAGAGGVLVILRMLRARAHRRTAGCGRRSRPVRAAGGLRRRRSRTSPAHCSAPRRPRGPVLVGINCRDLQSLRGGAGALCGACAARCRGGWPAVAESGVATPADARGDAPARLSRRPDRHGADEPRRSGGAARGNSSTRHGQCSAKWLHSRAMWIKICGITSADAVSAAAEAQVDAIGFVFAPSPRQVTPGQAAQLAALAPPGHSANRGRSASAADEGRRDLPHVETGLLSDRRRGSARTEDSRAHQGAAGRALRPQDAEPAAARASCSRGRRAASASWPTGAAPRSSRDRPRSFWRAACRTQNVAEAIQAVQAVRRRRE